MCTPSSRRGRKSGKMPLSHTLKLSNATRYGELHHTLHSTHAIVSCYQDNITLVRDAATLQAHLRQYDALVDSRLTLLKLRPNLRQHWAALAVAYHLNDDLEEADKILRHYEDAIKVRRIHALSSGPSHQYYRKSQTMTPSTRRLSCTTFVFWRPWAELPKPSPSSTRAQSREQLLTERRSWSSEVGCDRVNNYLASLGLTRLMKLACSRTSIPPRRKVHGEH